MDINKFVDKYWHEAVQAERTLHIPAIYLLAHAATETDFGNTEASNLIHGFEVVLPIKKVNVFTRLWNWIKNLFRKKDLPKKSETQVSIGDDVVISFFKTASYHVKFEFLQSENRFCDYLYKGKKNEAELSAKMKDTMFGIAKAVFRDKTKD